MLGAFRYQSIRTGLVGHWRPSRGPSNTLIDLVLGNHGTLVNGPTWNPSGGGGNGGWSIRNDGTDDYVNVTQNIISAFPFTLACWFNLATTGANRYLFTIGQESTLNHYVALIANASNQFEIATRNSSTLVTTNGGTLVANRWYFACATISPTTQTIYGDGVSLNAGTPVTQNSLANINFGRLVSRGLFSGGNAFLIDDLTLFNRVLQPSEIITLYTAGRGALDQRVNVTVVRGATTSTGTGSASITEANDTVSSTATIAIAAAASITELSDTVSSVSAIALRATAGITESSDTLSSASTIALRATLAVTEASDTCVGASTITSGITGTTGATEADDTLSSASTIALRATAGITEANDTVTSTSTLLLRAVLAVTEASDSLSSASTISDVGLPPQIDGSPYAAWYVQNTEAW